MEEPEKEEKENIVTQIKTFSVPFALQESKGDLFISTDITHQASKEQIINQAFKFHSQGNISEASKYYQYFIEQGFKDCRVFSNYGLILNNIGKLQEAELSYRKAIEIKPDFAEAHSNLGNILSDFGKLDQALICFQLAIDIDKNLDSALEGIGRLFLKKGFHSDGIIKLRQAIGSIDFNPKKSSIDIH